MNHHSFLYPIPFSVPQYFGFPQFAAQVPYYLLPTISYQQQVGVTYQESHGKTTIEMKEQPIKTTYCLEETQLDIVIKHQKPKIKTVLKAKGIKKFKVERVRDQKGRYSGVCILPSPQKPKQNRKRNLIIDIGNQLLVFLSDRSKSLSVIQASMSNITVEEIENFYKIVEVFGNRAIYYINGSRYSEMWDLIVTTQPGELDRNKKLFRQVSLKYLTDTVRLFVLCSSKIKSPSKIYHLKAIRSLIQEITQSTSI